MARLPLLLALLLSLPSGARAEAVTLTAPGLTLRGEIVGWDGTLLSLDTPAGEVSVDARVARCAGDACPAPGDPPLWRLAGEARLAAVVLPALVEGFAADRGLEARRSGEGEALRYDLVRDGRTALRVALSPSTTAEGLATLAAGGADAALLARAPTAAETAALEAAGRLLGEPRLRLLGRDALVAATGRGQRVTRIALPDLARAFGGEIRSWEALGGDDRPIRLHLGPEGSADAEGFAARVLEPAGLALAAGVRRHPDAASLAAALAADPQGLGILPFEQFGDAQPLILEGACGLPWVPRAAAVRAGDYPLTLPLALLPASRRPAPIVRDLLAWMASPEAQLALRRAGLAGSEAVPIPLAEQGERLAAAIAAAGPEVPLSELQRLVAELGPLTRLSTTARFEEGTTLDAPSRALLLGLAAEVAAGRWDGRRIVLAGFSDGAGPAPGNLALSRDRALAAEAALREALGAPWPGAVGLEARAFGEALPLGCDGEGEGPWAAAVNRRVEVWVD